MSDKKTGGPSVSRRKFVGSAIAGGVATVLPAGALAQDVSAELVKCTLTVNGQPQEVQVDPRVTLLDLLREHLHLTGSKKGCDHGQCGACTVLLNGKRINSCLTLAVMHDGDKVTTIEGLADGSNLHPMQASFIEHDGFQCGYCTPGQIMSGAALMKEPIGPSDDDVRAAMSGNICRCGAYHNIVAAVQQARGTGSATS